MRIAGIVTLTIIVASACAPEAGEAQGVGVCYLQRATLEEATARPSPLGATSIPLGDGEATLCYGRPSARGRPIMGGLVPYGTPWRMGANEATALHLPFAAEVAGVRLEPGVYSLYAEPADGPWTIVLNRSAERWGIPINDDVKAADLDSFEVRPERLQDPVETLTWTWMPRGADRGDLIMAWENTRLTIPIERPKG